MSQITPLEDPSPGHRFKFVFEEKSINSVESSLALANLDTEDLDSDKEKRAISSWRH
jgi:hypothetical protein